MVDIVDEINDKVGGNEVLNSGRNDNVGAVFEGFVYIPESDDWEFGTISDDGSKLFIHDELVVDNDGLHGDREVKGSMALAEGMHPFRVEFFERGGWSTIIAKGGNGGEYPYDLIPAEAFFHRSACRGGLNADMYTFDDGLREVPDVRDMEPTKSFKVDVVDWNAGGGQYEGVNDRFAVVYRGWVEIPAGGSWTFGTASDDGSLLYIDNELVVDNDGLHGRREVKGNVDLEPGMHMIRAEMFENGGGANMQVFMGHPDVMDYQIAPAELLHNGNC